MNVMGRLLGGSSVSLVLTLLAAFLIPAIARGAAPGEGAKAAVQVLSLKEALAIAAEKNRDIEKAREYLVHVQGRYIEERAAALPQLTATATIGQDKDESQKIYSPLQTERIDRRSVKLGFTQPLFTWGQVSAAIRAAEGGIASAEEQLRLARQAAQLAVASAFYDVLLAREIQALALQNLEQKKRHLDEARRRHQAGVATDYDVLAARVSMENARPETIRSVNALRAARDRLRFLLAIEGRDVDIAGSLEPGVAPDLTCEAATALAIKNRPDLAELRNRIRVYEERLIVTAAQNKPRIDLKGEYGWNYLEQPGLYGDGPAWNVGIQLSFPFFDGMRTKGRIIQAKSDVKSLKIDEVRQRERIALEVRDALHAVRESGEILHALSGTVTQAERLLEMAERGYALGVKTRIDVEDAELNLKQARGSMNRARRDVLVAGAQLEWVTGVLGE